MRKGIPRITYTCTHTHTHMGLGARVDVLSVPEHLKAPLCFPGPYFTAAVLSIPLCTVQMPRCVACCLSWRGTCIASQTIFVCYVGRLYESIGGQVRQNVHRCSGHIPSAPPSSTKSTSAKKTGRQLRGAVTYISSVDTAYNVPLSPQSNGRIIAK